MEIPFCSHSCVQAAGKPEEAADPAVIEKTKKVTKEEENTKIVLSPDEQLAAEDILRQLVDIKQSNRGEPNPVLDTMIRYFDLLIVCGGIVLFAKMATVKYIFSFSYLLTQVRNGEGWVEIHLLIYRSGFA